MPRRSNLTRILSSSSLAVLAACTQAPVDVDLRGQNNYGYSNSGSSAPIRATSGYVPPPSGPAYTTTSETAHSTEASASVQSIGVSDLAPPSAATSPPPSAQTAYVQQVPQPAGQSRVLTPPAQPTLPGSPEGRAINPWTNKPHFSDSVTVSDMPPPAQTAAPVTIQSAAPVAKLDQVIGNEGDNEPKAGQSAKAAADKGMQIAAKNSKGFIWPVSSKKIISGYGPKGGGKVNDGLNIASAEGEPVWAAADGEVVYAGNELQGYGNMVLIKHPGGKTTAYAHLSRASVDKYARVRQGDVIGYVGSTGGVKEPQLHFALRNGKEPLDPQKALGD